MRLLEAAPYKESTADCLNDFFFDEYLSHLDQHLFEDYPNDEAYELQKAAVEERKELFKEARDWSLDILVASAVYYSFSTEAEQDNIISRFWISRFWSYFFWPFLVFDKPLFDMLRAKDWGQVYRKEIREGFRDRLRREIRGISGNRLVWGSDDEKSWFSCRSFTRHIYPEDVLRCLDLIGIDPGRAQWAVDKVFKLHRLTPLYRVLSETRAAVLRHRYTDRVKRGEGGGRKSPNKWSAFNSVMFILGGFGLAIACNRLRLSSFYWASIQSSAPFATINLPGQGCIKRSRPGVAREGSSSQSQEQTAVAVARTSDVSMSDSRPQRNPLISRRSDFFRRVGSFTGRLSLQRDNTLNTRKQWAPHLPYLQELVRDESLQAQLVVQSQPSLQSHPLADQSSIESSDEAAVQAEALRRQRSTARKLWDGLKIRNTKAKAKFKELLSKAEFKKLYTKLALWVNDERILLSRSPVMKAWKAKLEKEGLALPLSEVDGMCVHLKRIPTESGKYGDVGFKYNIYGTATEHRAVDDLKNYLQKYLVIGNLRVKADDSRYEKDHVLVRHASSMSNLRHEKESQDPSPVIILPKPVHQIKSNMNKRNAIRFRLDKLTLTLTELFEEVRNADQDVWHKRENEEILSEYGLDPIFVARQYGMTHNILRDRMEAHLKSKHFHRNQATAFLLNEKVIEANESAATIFVSTTFPLFKLGPKLDTESKRILSEFDGVQRAEVDLKFADKMRSYSLNAFKVYTAECVQLLHTLELYANSSVGQTEGCNASQTERHRETKMQLINRFPVALYEANIPKADIKKAEDEMLKLANVKKDGTLRAGDFSKKLSKGKFTDQQLREFLGKVIYKLGTDLNLNTLHTQAGNFKLAVASDSEQLAFYKDSVTEVRDEATVASSSTQQQSEEWFDATEDLLPEEEQTETRIQGATQTVLLSLIQLTFKVMARW